MKSLVCLLLLMPLTAFGETNSPTTSAIQTNLARAFYLSGKIIQIVDEGIVLHFDWMAVSGKNEAMRMDEDQDRFLVGYPNQSKVADGDLIKFRAYPDGVFKKDGQTIQRWIYCGVGH